MDDMLHRYTPTLALVGVLDITCTPVIMFLLPLVASSFLGPKTHILLLPPDALSFERLKILVVNVIGFTIFLNALANLSMVINTVVAFIIS